MGLVVLGIMLLVAAIPARGVAAEPRPIQVGTWVGRVETHAGDGKHFDYSGRACPVEQERAS